MRLTSLLAFASLALSGCTTPYSPSVVVHGSPNFVGLAQQLDPARPLEVVLVHGMCTHTEAWAESAMRGLSTALDSSVKLGPRNNKIPDLAELVAKPAVRVLKADAYIDGSILRMSAILWSPLTAPLKSQLEYDNTDEPTDCSTDAKCKPKRAKFNGLAKDKLLNDCLSDAMAYQGASRQAMQGAMVDALTHIFKDTPADARIVLISDSLGSKLAFDALSDMLLDAKPNPAKAVAARLGQIFMNANQLPILGLADQVVGGQLSLKAAAPIGKPDALQRLLRARPVPLTKANPTEPSLAVIAFTDPNDLLSYRLIPTRYATPDVAVSDVLVSNEKTILGLVERPDSAHTEYMANPDVVKAIACGIPKSARCR